MYLYLIFMAVFEICIFLLHYYVMGEFLGKTSDFEPFVVKFLSVIWGIMGSLVPILIYYVYFIFSPVKKALIDTSKARTEQIKEATEKLVSNGITVDKVFVLLLPFFLMIYIAETSFFFKMLESSGSLFGGQKSFDLSALIQALAMSTSHFFITGVLVFFGYLQTQRYAYGFILRSLS